MLKDTASILFFFFCLGFYCIFGCTNGKAGAESDSGKKNDTATLSAGSNAIGGGSGIGGAILAGAGGDITAFGGEGGNGGNRGLAHTTGEAGAAGSTPTCSPGNSADDKPVPNFNSGGSGVVTVSAGADYTCAINAENRLVCWGVRNVGGLSSICGIPPTNANSFPGSYTQVSTGPCTICAIRTDGKVICWGDGTSPVSGSFIQVNATMFRACGVRSDGNVVCWGKLPDMGPKTMGSIEPAPDPPAGTYLQVMARAYGSITLDSDGKVASWDPSQGWQATALGSGVFTLISSGTEACAINKKGNIACAAKETVGLYPYPQTSTWLNVLGTPDGSYLQVSVGGGHSCAVRDDGRVVCWGDNTYKEYHDFTDSAGYSCVSPDGSAATAGSGCTALCRSGNSSLTTIPGGSYKAVSAGNRHACAVKSDGSIACWGNNNCGQTMLPSGPYQQISPQCAIKSDSSITCWQGDASDERIITDIPSGPFVYVSSDRVDACAIKDDYSIVCWGYDYSQTPALYPAAGSYTQVSIGGLGACAITTEGTIRCWETAPGTATDTDGNILSMPAAPQGASYTQVSPGDFAICAIKNDGTIVCTGDASIANTPAGSYKQVHVAGTLACAIKKDGTLICWGTRANSAGDMVPFSEPVAGSFTQVDFGRSGDRCALKTDRTVVCWKSDGSSESPAGTYTQIAIGDGSCGLDTEGSVNCWYQGVYLPAKL